MSTTPESKVPSVPLRSSARTGGGAPSATTSSTPVSYGVDNTTLSLNAPSPLQPAPTFYPTEEEFSDPHGYVRKIRHIAEKTGICKIVPPKSWRPPFCLDFDKFQFRSKIQRLDMIQKRSGQEALTSLSGTSANSNSNANANAEEDKNKSKRKAGPNGMTRATSATRSKKRTKTSSSTPADYSTTGCEICQGSDYDDKILLCDACDLGFHIYCLSPPLSEIPSDDWYCPQCLATKLNTFGFDMGRTFTLRQFEHHSDKFRDEWFAKHPANSNNENQTQAMDTSDGAAASAATSSLPSASAISEAFWNILENSTTPVSVDYGSDLDSEFLGSGFPSEGPYTKMAFNVNNLAMSKGGILNWLDDKMLISGVTIPWLYVGMIFSTFCWHTEDHWMYSVNYVHSGAAKQWYGVPSSSMGKFEKKMRQALPDLFQLNPDLLFQLVTMLNPLKLATQANGGSPSSDDPSIYYLLQEPGEFVLTFSGGYHAGFNHGFNVAESVNFGGVEWLPYGFKCIERYRFFRRSPIFNHEQLVMRMCDGVIDAFENVVLRGQAKIPTKYGIKNTTAARIFQAAATALPAFSNSSTGANAISLVAQMGQKQSLARFADIWYFASWLLSQMQELLSREIACRNQLLENGTMRGKIWSADLSFFSSKRSDSKDLKKSSTSSSSSSSSHLSVGTIVSATWHGNPAFNNQAPADPALYIWYDGTIINYNPSTCLYSVQFHEDGLIDDNVLPKHIRVKTSTSHLPVDTKGKKTMDKATDNDWRAYQACVDDEDTAAISGSPMSRQESGGEMKPRKVKMSAVDFAPDASSLVSCAICRHALYISCVRCSCCPEKASCLLHSQELCACRGESKTLYFRYTIWQMQNMLQQLQHIVNHRSSESDQQRIARLRIVSNSLASVPNTNSAAVTPDQPPKVERGSSSKQRHPIPRPQYNALSDSFEWGASERDFPHLTGDDDTCYIVKSGYPRADEAEESSAIAESAAPLFPLYPLQYSSNIAVFSMNIGDDEDSELPSDATCDGGSLDPIVIDDIGITQGPSLEYSVPCNRSLSLILQESKRVIHEKDDYLLAVGVRDEKLARAAEQRQETKLVGFQMGPLSHGHTHTPQADNEESSQDDAAGNRYHPSSYVYLSVECNDKQEKVRKDAGEWFAKYSPWIQRATEIKEEYAALRTKLQEAELRHFDAIQEVITASMSKASLADSTSESRVDFGFGLSELFSPVDSSSLQSFSFITPSQLEFALYEGEKYIHVEESGTQICDLYGELLSWQSQASLLSHKLCNCVRVHKQLQGKSRKLREQINKEATAACVGSVATELQGRVPNESTVASLDDSIMLREMAATSPVHLTCSCAGNVAPSVKALSVAAAASKSLGAAMYTPGMVCAYGHLDSLITLAHQTNQAVLLASRILEPSVMNFVMREVIALPTPSVTAPSFTRCVERFQAFLEPYLDVFDKLTSAPFSRVKYKQLWYQLIKDVIAQKRHALGEMNSAYLQSASASFDPKVNPILIPPTNIIVGAVTIPTPTLPSTPTGRAQHSTAHSSSTNAGRSCTPAKATDITARGRARPKMPSSSVPLPQPSQVPELSSTSSMSYHAAKRLLTSLFTPFINYPVQSPSVASAAASSPDAHENSSSQTEATSARSQWYYTVKNQMQFSPFAPLLAVLYESLFEAKSLFPQYKSLMEPHSCLQPLDPSIVSEPPYVNGVDNTELQLLLRQLAMICWSATWWLTQARRILARSSDSRLQSLTPIECPHTASDEELDRLPIPPLLEPWVTEQAKLHSTPPNVSLPEPGYIATLPCCGNVSQHLVLYNAKKRSESRERASFNLDKFSYCCAKTLLSAPILLLVDIPELQLLEYHVQSMNGWISRVAPLIPASVYRFVGMTPTPTAIDLESTTLANRYRDVTRTTGRSDAFLVGLMYESSGLAFTSVERHLLQNHVDAVNSWQRQAGNRLHFAQAVCQSFLKFIRRMEIIGTDTSTLLQQEWQQLNSIVDELQEMMFQSELLIAWTEEYHALKRMWHQAVAMRNSFQQQHNSYVSSSSSLTPEEATLQATEAAAAVNMTLYPPQVPNTPFVPPSAATTQFVPMNPALTHTSAMYFFDPSTADVSMANADAAAAAAGAIPPPAMVGATNNSMFRGMVRTIGDMLDKYDFAASDQIAAALPRSERDIYVGFAGSTMAKYKANVQAAERAGIDLNQFRALPYSQIQALIAAPLAERASLLEKATAAAAALKRKQDNHGGDDMLDGGDSDEDGMGRMGMVSRARKEGFFASTTSAPPPDHFGSQPVATVEVLNIPPPTEEEENNVALPYNPNRGAAQSGRRKLLHFLQERNFFSDAGLLPFSGPYDSFGNIHRSRKDAAIRMIQDEFRTCPIWTRKFLANTHSNHRRLVATRNFSNPTIGAGPVTKVELKDNDEYDV